MRTKRAFQRKQEALHVFTTAVMCYMLASLWQFQYFRRAIHKSVEHLWWSFYCENSKLLMYSQKRSIVDARLGSKSASAFWWLFERFISLKYFAMKTLLHLFFFINNPFLTLAPKLVKALLKNRPKKLFSNCLVDGQLTSIV